MAVSSLQSNAFSPRPVDLMGAQKMPTYKGPESASHQGIDNSIVKFVSGYLDALAADDVVGIVGIQIGPGHNDGSAGTHNLSYCPALPGLVVEITLEDQTNENHALVATNVGASYALQLDNDGVWYLDENDTTAISMTVIGYPADTKIGDVRARVYATFIGSATIWAA